MDGDGVPDAMDNCPMIFNPIRPMDGGKQADADGDGIGDACDPCPLDANTTTCTTANPDDRDHDGVPNETDNCPDTANPDQKDTDMDGKGDACDACPMDANPGAAGCPSNIYQIKTMKWPTGTVLHVTGALVTAKGTNGFFVQVKETDTGYTGPDNSGVFVFTSTGALLTTATVGARVTVDGSFDIFNGELELDNVTNVSVDAAGPESPPAPTTVAYTDIATGGTRAATLEGVIVQLPASTVTAVNAAAGEITVTAGATSLIVDDFVLPFTNPPLNQAYNSLAGVLANRQAASKLEPRTAADLVLGPPGIASFGPALSFIRQGAANGTTFPAGSELTVTLTGPSQGGTTVAIASSDPTVTVTGGGVTIPDGATSGTVQLSATAQKPAVTLTATLGTQTPLTATVRVLGTAEAPATVTLAPSTVAVKSNGSVTLTATLDIPALTAATVTLAQAPTSGTLPASVQIAANQLQASFTYTDTTGNNTTITGTFGASTSQTSVTVSNAPPHLVINEVDYDNVGTDTAEYIEVFNPTVIDADLTNVVVMLVNGSDSSVYTTIQLASVGVLPAGGYLVIGGPNVSVPTGALVLTPAGWKAQDNIQNGAPDGMALVDTSGPTVLDALSYEGSITAAKLTGFAAPVNLVEGTATTALDNNTTVAALCRSPNGQDSDNAAADWKVCTTLTPGAANQ